MHIFHIINISVFFILHIVYLNYLLWFAQLLQIGFFNTPRQRCRRFNRVAVRALCHLRHLRRQPSHRLLITVFRSHQRRARRPWHLHRILKVSVDQRNQRGPSCSRSCRHQHQAQALSHLHNSQMPMSRSILRYFLQKALVVTELVFSTKNDSAPYDRWLVLCSLHQLAQLQVNVHSAMLV